MAGGGELQNLLKFGFMNLSEATKAFNSGKTIKITNEKTGKTKTFKRSDIAKMFQVDESKVNFRSNCIAYGCHGWKISDLSYSIV